MESCEPLHYRKTRDSYILGEMINNHILAGPSQTLEQPAHYEWRVHDWIIECPPAAALGLDGQYGHADAEPTIPQASVQVITCGGSKK